MNTVFFSLRKMALVLALLSTPVTAFGQQTVPPPDKAGDPDTDVIRAILLKEMIHIIEGNINASDRENGEINKLIRALSGVSVKDIQQFGICGGSNSEVRKILGSLCSKVN